MKPSANVDFVVHSNKNYSDSVKKGIIIGILQTGFPIARSMHITIVSPIGIKVLKMTSLTGIIRGYYQYFCPASIRIFVDPSHSLTNDLSSGHVTLPERMRSWRLDVKVANSNHPTADYLPHLVTVC